MKNTMKRLFACLIVLAMVLPVCLSAFALESVQTVDFIEAKTAATIDTTGIRNGKTFAAADNSAATEAFADDQIVNILVELEAAPAMEVYGEYKDATGYADNLLVAQKDVVREIEATLGIDVEVIYNYTLLFNGFAFAGEYALVEKLNNMEGITATVAAEWKAPTIQLHNSADMVGAIGAWDIGYTGVGDAVAIVDTGLKVTHEAFSVLPDEDTVRYTRDDIAAIIAGGQLNGNNMNVSNVYYSAKIPFRWNYYSNNYNVSHTNSDHGTHVAGIAAGNGGEIQGVAPDAQIVVMQVFAPSGGASWVQIIAALEDCVVLGVGSANLSLGSANGTTAYDQASYGQVFENLVNAGVNLAMAAGNDGSSAIENAWGGYSLISNPDYAVVGSPSTWPESLSVASVDNSRNLVYYVEAEDGSQYPYTENEENRVKMSAVLGNQTVEYVAVPGWGEPSDFASVNVAGKVALVSRGEINFVDKGLNAQAAGAIACIVYNNAYDAVNMVSDPGINIPFVFLGKDAGDALAAEGTGEIFIAAEPALLSVVGGGLPSSFSSWGAVSELHIKPEITAPGGNIYSATDSAISGANYQAWNGTSMATPHVAGGMVIVAEYVDEMFPNATAGEKQVLVDTILMSTADPIADADGSFAAVRKQGAGLMDLEGAVTTTTYITVEGNARPKVELGDDPAKTGYYTFSFTVNNFGTEDVAYSVVPYVLTDNVASLGTDPDGNDILVSTQTSFDITEFCDITAPMSVVVPADGSVDVNVEIQLSDDIMEYFEAYYVSGAYVEGFIQLHAADEGASGMGDANADGEVTVEDALLIMRYAAEFTSLSNPAVCDINGDGMVDMTDALLVYRHVLGIDISDVIGGNTRSLAEDAENLSVPFLGFYGDWNYAPMLDIGYYYDDFSYGSHPYDNTIGASKGNVIYGLGINPYVDTDDMSYYNEDRNAISPNGDGFLDTADTLYAGLMRNATEMYYNLYNAQGTKVATLAQSYDVWKGFFYDSIADYYQVGVHHMIMPNWNATSYIGQDLVIAVEATFGNDGSVTTNAYTPEANAHPVWEIPVYVDVTAPVVSNVTGNAQSITFDITDEHYVAYVGTWTGSSSDEAVVIENVIEEMGLFEDERGVVSEITLDATNNCYICVADYAGNENVYHWNGSTLTDLGSSWSSGSGGGFALPTVDFYGYGQNLNTPSWFRVALAEAGGDGVYLAGGMAGDNNSYTAGCYTGTYVYGVDDNENLYRYDASDITTWSAIQNLGRLSNPTGYVINEMAYDPTTDTLWAITGAGVLCEVDLDAMSLVEYGDIPWGVVAIDFDDDGMCYFVDAYGCLDTLDMTTGALTEIADLGIVPINGSNFILQSGCVNNGYFYWWTIPGNATMYSQSSLIVASCETGEYQNLGPIIGGLFGVGAFVYEFEAPEASVEPNDFYENFEGNVEWMVVDADGDGNNWGLEYQSGGFFYDGSRTVVSYSWNEEILYPDNWLISPEFTIEDDGNEKFLSFWTASRNTGEGADIDEHYQVLIAPAGSEYTSDFTAIYETTMDTANLTEHVINVSDYAGQDVMIAFRHFNCFDEYTLIIDAVGVGNWIGEGTAPDAAISIPCELNIAVGGVAMVEAVLPTSGKNTVGIED